MVTVLQGENGRLRVAAVHTEAEGGDKAYKFPNEYSGRFPGNRQGSYRKYGR